jgi:hypothetical protein
MATALGTARASLGATLTGLGINLRKSPSEGHISPPAAIVVPAPEWVVANAQLGGSIIHSRVGFRVLLITGKVAAEASLVDLEGLVETVLLEVTKGEAGQWVIGTVSGPAALTVAGTEYLSAAITLTRNLSIAQP